MGRGVLILGGGPAGLAAAFRLARAGREEVLLLEAGDGFGGHARTIAWRGHRLDLGGHRIPADGDPGILADLRELLGADLLTRPRRARVQVLGRWVRHPLRPRWLIRRAPEDTYLYPRRGIGQVCDRLREEAARAGADLRLRHPVGELVRTGDGFEAVVPGRGTFRAGRVLSTLPVTDLAGLLRPSPPADARAAARRVRFQALLVVFLEFAADRFSDHDTHLLPSAEHGVTRITEAKAFADRTEPAGRTAIAAEIPCPAGSEVFAASEVELAARVTEALSRSRLPLPGLPTGVHVVRLPGARPDPGPESDLPLAMVRKHLRGIPGLVTLDNPGSGASGGILDAIAAGYAGAAPAD